MQVFVPRVSAVTSWNGQRLTLVRGRKPLVEEGHPILAEIGGLMEPLKVDFPAPEKTRQPAEAKKTEDS